MAEKQTLKEAIKKVLEEMNSEEALAKVEDIRNVVDSGIKIGKKARTLMKIFNFDASKILRVTLLDRKHKFVLALATLISSTVISIIYLIKTLFF